MMKSSDKNEQKNLLAKGEVSAIYGVENNGETDDIHIKSEYLKKAQEFLSTHNKINNNSGLMMTMESLAMGLALIDCVGEQGLVDNDKAKSIEDYNNLQERLSDENVDDEEKQAIEEFLKIMVGKAMQILQKYCKKNKAKSTAKKSETKETREAKERLKEIAVEIDKWQDFVNGSVAKFDEALNGLSFKMGDYSVDANKLQEQMDDLLRATEGIKHSAIKTEEINDEYLQELIKDRELLSEREYNEGYLWAIRSEEKVAKARQKVVLMNEYGGEIQGYITRAKEALNKMVA